MSEKRPGSKVFLVVVMAIPVITSIVVACATGATSPAPAPTETSNTETEPMEPAPTLTVAPADTPQPSSTATPTNAPPTDTPAPQPTPTAEEGSLMANAQHGQELFNSLGCAACHGAQGEGGIGPTIAGTELSLARIVRQYRAPYQSMPRFGPDQVSESDIADIYAFLQTLPTPETRVPSVLANVTPEAGIGTIRGIIRYMESGKPAPDEQVFVVPASLNADGSLEANSTSPMSKLSSTRSSTRGKKNRCLTRTEMSHWQTSCPARPPRSRDSFRHHEECSSNTISETPQVDMHG